MRKFLPSPQLCCLIALALTAQTALLEAAEPADAPVQTTEQFYPSVDGGQVHCYPNFTDSPRGKETRERLLTRGPKVDLATLVGLGSSASPAQVSEFQKQMEEQRTNDWAYLCRYRQDNARIIASGHSPEAVFIGDSLTENWPAAHPEFFKSGYLGRGISGQTSSQMVNRFYSDVVALKPHVVHILAGTNDVNGARGPATQDDVLNNIKAIVAMARANHIAVVLASIPPIDPSSRKPGFNPDPSVVALNHRMRELAHQWHLVFVDYYTVLTDGHGNLRQTLANDGLHPNRAGYDLMEPLARRAIAQAKASPAS
jgi:lysophospholipase L1-like esterase